MIRPEGALPVFDMHPAAARLSELVSGVRDDQLPGPTPCSDWAVADLLAHVHQFATVFTQNARKEPVRPPTTLVGNWREAIPERLAELAGAWREESAWSGRVSAGGIEMDAAANAVVAIEELTVHGWDLARATGHSLRIDDSDLDQVDRFFELFAEQIASGQGPYGPEVSAPAAAARLDRTIARTGRDPAWQAGRGR